MYKMGVHLKLSPRTHVARVHKIRPRWGEWGRRGGAGERGVVLQDLNRLSVGVCVCGGSAEFCPKRPVFGAFLKFDSGERM